MKPLARDVTDSLAVSPPHYSEPVDVVPANGAPPDGTTANGISTNGTAISRKIAEAVPVPSRESAPEIPPQTASQKSLALFTIRLVITLAAAWVGAQVGFFVWFFLLLSLGYPANMPDGTSSPSLSYVLHSSDWQVALEYCGSLAVPVLSASLCALAAWRLQTRREMD